jgi:thiol-disulfide isomerase/thioredoxin
MNPSEILLRSLITLALCALGVLAYGFLKKLNLSENSHKVHKLSGYQHGKAGIILFSSPTCTPCKTVQKPVIERILSKMGNSLQFLEIDASLQPDLANEWGVVSVPTTYLVEPSGKSRFVNFGLVNEKKLTEQLKELL